MEQRRVQTTSSQQHSLDGRRECEKSTLQTKLSVQSLIWQRRAGEITTGENGRWKIEKASSETGAPGLWGSFPEKKAGPAMLAPVDCKTGNSISSMLDGNWNSNPFESLMKFQFKNRASQNPKPSSTPRWFSQRLFSVHTSNLAHMH